MGYAGYAPGHSVQELTEVIILLLLGVLFVSYCLIIFEIVYGPLLDALRDDL